MRTERPLDRARAVLRASLPELTRRRALVYWIDLLLTVFVAWTALGFGAALASDLDLELSTGTRLVLIAPVLVVAVLALYRASAHLHEVTHVRRAMPAWAWAWDVLIGAPLLLPSIVYEGVHDTHHHHAVFGTDGDPEYVRHDGTGPGTSVTAIAGFALVPLMLLARWTLLAPASALHPSLRRHVVERFSSFAGNPRYRRPFPEGAAAWRFRALEIACWAWSTTLVIAALSGALPIGALAFVAITAAAVSVLHGARSFATHRFHGEGSQRTVDEQFLDSVNVTGSLLTELWAPCGLRYHALHHLFPRLPYHALGEAHRRLLRSLPPDHPYRAVTFDGLRQVIAYVRAGTGERARSSGPRKIAT